MSILITGAAGFIGFHLVNSLLNEKCRVIGIDSLSNYYDINLKYKRLNNLGIDTTNITEENRVSNNNYFTFIKQDIKNKDEIEKIFKQYNIEYVVHLAGQPGVRYSLENPEVYVEDNILGFTNILNICTKYNVKHFVYASSSSVYGMNKEIPYKESCCVDHPVSLYAATKKCDEIIAHSYSALYKIPTTGLRFFTVYGPWGRPDMAAYKFADAIIQNKPIDIYNNGNMSRDFTYIDDIIEGIRMVIFNPPIEKDGADIDNNPSISSVPFDIYNIGSSNPVSLLEYISYFEKILNKKAIKNYLPMQKGDVKNTFADISKIYKRLNFKPKIPIEEGIKKYIEWHIQYYVLKKL